MGLSTRVGPFLALSLLVSAWSCEASSPGPQAQFYIPPDCAGAGLMSANAAASKAPAAPTNPPVSTAEQLAIFDQLVSTVNQQYVYPDFRGVDWPAIAADYRGHIAAGVSTTTFYADMSAVISALGDRHSSFLTPAEVAQQNLQLADDNRHVGIGVQDLQLPDKGLLAITIVYPGSPAAHAGLKPHDSILMVGGRPVYENPKGFAGPRCSLETLIVKSPGSAPRQVSLVRDTVAGLTAIDAELVHTTDGSRIGYIFIPTFDDLTIPGQISLALTSFGPLDGLILDNRTNGGGLQQIMEDTLGYFTSGVLGRIVSRSGSQPFDVLSNPNAVAFAVPLVVLISPHTYSAGELFSGMLKDEGRAKLVGSTTSGLIQRLNVFTLQDGSQAWIATGYFDPAASHADWAKTGIVPDVVVPAEWDTFTFDTDPAVAAAVKLLGHS
ncbi:MAG: S41 family peptidase [Candidatus Dormibacterales bacterium]